MEDTHANVIAGASSGLQRAAIGLGAEVIALLEADGPQVAVTYFWRRSGDCVPERRSLQTKWLLVGAVSGKAVVGTATAGILRDAISERSQSFLLFPLDGTQNAVTGVIGFTDADPPVSQVPEAVVETLNLLGWAIWSAREIARLRGELRTVNERLAGRKLVERAKSALQAERSLSEEQAYAYLRSLSRKRRITLATLSAEILGSRTGRSRAELLPAGNPGSTV
jgi:ANTAR domain-containing protein